MAAATPRLIGRGDLLAALDRAAARKVTVISAPAGSGKTSLLRAWADRPGQPYRLAVVQVQRDQHDAQQFWLALLHAVRQATGADSDAERFVTEFSGSDRTVAEYLIAEMLERQPADVQQLLLRTSLLDRVNGELADLLTGRPGSERILLELEDANAFVVSLDPERTWFRYHHLFADLLRLELRRRLPEEVPELHRRAAGWFTRHGQVTEAIRHTQAAGDWANAARLLADQSFSLTLDGQAQTMQALLRAFPQGAAADDPRAGPGARRG